MVGRVLAALLLSTTALPCLSSVAVAEDAQFFENASDLTFECNAWPYIVSNQRHNEAQVTGATQCLAYVTAVADTLIRAKAACIPLDVKLGQLLERVSDALNTDADKTPHPAAGIVAKALTTAYPCKSP